MNAQQEITTIEQAAIPVPAVQSDTSAIVSMIERAAMNPAVDIDKMERLLQMQERILDKAAKSAYATAFASMQGDLPSIERNGKITIRDKNDREKIIQETAFAKWEDINDAIRPVLQKYGFGLSFRVGQTSEGRITVTCVLAHREGHSEETTMVLMHDSSGSKNSVQAIGSSVSYGKRYTASAILNITSHGEDDDGQKAVEIEPITEDQVLQIRDLLLANNKDEKRFLAHIKLASLSDIAADKFKAACAIISGSATK